MYNKINNRTEAQSYTGQYPNMMRYIWLGHNRPSSLLYLISRRALYTAIYLLREYFMYDDMAPDLYICGWWMDGWYGDAEDYANLRTLTDMFTTTAIKMEENRPWLILFICFILYIFMNQKLSQEILYSVFCMEWIQLETISILVEFVIQPCLFLIMHSVSYFK